MRLGVLLPHRAVVIQSARRPVLDECWTVARMCDQSGMDIWVGDSIVAKPRVDIAQPDRVRKQKSWPQLQQRSLHRLDLERHRLKCTHTRWVRLFSRGRHLPKLSLQK